MVYFRMCFGFEAARPEWSRRGGVLCEGQRVRSPSARGLGSAVSSPSGVPGEAPAEIDLGTFSTL